MADIINADPHAGNQTPIDITNGEEITIATKGEQCYKRAHDIVIYGIGIRQGDNGNIVITGVTNAEGGEIDTNAAGTVW